MEIAVHIQRAGSSVSHLSAWFLGAVLVGAALVSCGLPSLGDAGYSVMTKNGSGVALTVFVDDVGAKPGTLAADGVRLEPGADFVDHWVVPSGPQDQRRAKVRAVTSAGDLYYCHGFGFEELKNLQFHILLGPGVSDCRT